ncbi:MAG TPA: peptidoglycan DD-metalloendopeptidase family protein, partial [Arenibaculum sp.]|nr:peptidoglycan DD-metalloendopeptidase family protein [Arenibaculum sp.]
AEKAAEKAAETAAQAAAAIRPPSPPGREAATLLPATGKVILRYGEADEFGNASRGLTIATRPGAAVISPFDGSIMFAGPFKGYGQILIVEHADGYHSLIAGLGRIDTRVGQQVLAGEPIGAMATRGDGTPDLYFELRRKGQPINPQRGISASNGRGQG